MAVSILRSSYTYFPVQETLDEMDVERADHIVEWIRENTDPTSWMEVNGTMIMSGARLLSALQAYGNQSG